MAEVLEKEIVLPVRSKPKSALPKMAELLTAPLMANGLIVSFLLFEKHLSEAGAIAGGCGVGLLLFAGLHYFAENVFGMLFSSTGSKTEPMPGSMMVFGLMAGGKFLLIAVLMYLLIAVLHLNIVAFVVGFIITQICVSLSVMSRMAKSKITD